MTATQQPNFLIITLLRIVFNGQPIFLETICLAQFLKMLQRLVRDYMPSSHVQYGVITPHHDQNQKYMAEVLYLSLEMILPRISAISTDAKRSLTQFILTVLIEKLAADKILEMVIKINHEILTSSVAGPNLAIPILIKIYESLETKIMSNLELQRLYLNSILYVLENDSMRTVEIALKLNIPFFWGLCCIDRSIRNR